MKHIITLGLLVFLVVTLEAQTFLDALDHYFLTGDLTQARLFIGRLVSVEEMRELQNKYYSGGGWSIEDREPWLVVKYSLSGSRAIIYAVLIQQDDYEIRDVKGIEIKPGYVLIGDQLLSERRLPRDDAIGMVMIKKSERSLEESRRLIPNWIITADGEGKLLLSEPQDTSQFIYQEGWGGLYIPGYSDYYPTDRKGVVNDRNVRLRETPDLEGKQIRLLDQGTAVEVLEETPEPMKVGTMEAKWYRVKLEDGTTGWMYGQYLDLPPKTPAPTAEPVLEGAAPTVRKEAPAGTPERADIFVLFPIFFDVIGVIAIVIAVATPVILLRKRWKDT